MPGKSAGRPKNQTHKQKMWFFFPWIIAAKKSANTHSETNVENTPQNIFNIFHGILVVFILLETANNSVIYEETIVSNGIWQLNCWLQGSALVLLIGNSAFIHKREQKLMKPFGFLLKQERSLNVLEIFIFM